MLAIGALPAVVKADSLGISPFPYFTMLAVSTVYIGSKRGLLNREMEYISIKQGAAAPFVLSLSLFGVYIVSKLEISLETFITGYFFFLETLAGCFSLSTVFGIIGKRIGEQPVATIDPEKASWLLQASGEVTDEGTTRGKGSGTGTGPPSSVDVMPSFLLSCAGGLLLAFLERFVLHDNFTLNNIEACFIVMTWLEVLGVSSYKTAVTLLFGLLFYDVFWVFGSGRALKLASEVSGVEGLTPKNGSVMADVAMSPLISVPTKLLFPRAGDLAPAFKYSLLGLGDILVPGLLIGLLLRFDVNGGKGKGKGKGKGEGEGAEPRPYFRTALVAYGVGLLSSFTAAIITREGQPALLYLVPLVVSSSVAIGVQRAELGSLWAFRTKNKAAATAAKEGKP